MGKTKRDLAREMIDQFPRMSKIGLARQLCKKYPAKFTSVDDARSSVRGVTSAKGKGASDSHTDIHSGTMTNDEKDLVDKYREQKILLIEECKEAGIDPDEVQHYWYKSELFSIFAKPKEKSLYDLKAKLIEGMTKHSPKYPAIKRKKIKDAHLLLINIADLHIGKLSSAYETGEVYNVNIAVNRAIEAVEGLLYNTSNFPIETICLMIGNDILHTDTPKGTTTSGTAQDTDGLWYDNFMIAQKLLVRIIERLLPIANVHVIHLPSNHDWMGGWYLSQSIYSWFHNCKNITFDVDMRHRKAFKYHNNLIGSTHGDGAKLNNLALLLAHEFPLEWSSTQHRYIYTNHIHHKTSKDFMSVTIESSRSPSAPDSWHHRNGYVFAPQAIEAYVHHPLLGQIARFSHIFQNKK